MTKVTYDSQGLKMRFVVTSLRASKIPPVKLYTEKYCPRGEMENRIKEQQLELFSDRTSTHSFEGNQLRLWFSAVAYILMQAFRASCLARTPLATATVGTIRILRLLLGARVLSQATGSDLDFLVAVPIKTSLPSLINESRLFLPLGSSVLDLINLQSTFSKAGLSYQPTLL